MQAYQHHLHTCIEMQDKVSSCTLKRPPKAVPKPCSACPTLPNLALTTLPLPSVSAFSGLPHADVLLDLVDALLCALDGSDGAGAATASAFAALAFTLRLVFDDTVEVLRALAGCPETEACAEGSC